MTLHEVSSHFPRQRTLKMVRRFILFIALVQILGCPVSFLTKVVEKDTDRQLSSPRLHCGLQSCLN